MSTTGSDATGDGSATNPFATLVFAVTKVPFFIPPGVLYRIDITGVDELLPTDFALPEWKTWINDTVLLTNQTLTDFQPAVEIFATPQAVAAIPFADSIINAADVASVTTDPLTGLQTINLVTPRASWTAANILGKQVLVGPTDPNPTVNNSVVGQVFSTSSIQITNTAPPTYPLSLVEPSAHLHGSGTLFGTIIAANADNIGFTGIKITSDNGFYGLVAYGSGSCICALCELDTPFMEQQSANQFDFQANRVLRSWVYNFPSFGGVIGIVQSLVLNATPVSNFDSPFFCSPTDVTIRRSIFTGCDSIEVNVYEPGGNIDPAATPHILIQNTLVQNSTTGDGATFHGVRGHFTNCDFSNNSNNGITVDDGGGVLRLENVGSSVPNAGFGISIEDGMQVSADMATVVTNPGAGRGLTGTPAGNDIFLGSVGTVTWTTVAASINVADYAGSFATGARIHLE